MKPIECLSVVGVIEFVFYQRFSGEKPWDFSLHENSPYFVPATTWDRTCDLPNTLWNYV